MKKGLKIAGGILFAALGSYLAYRWIKKNYKKELSALKEEEERIEEELSKVGISKDTLERIITPEDEDKGISFLKSIYGGLRYNSFIDRDAIDIDLICEKKIDNVIHISESIYNKRRYLDIMFELPDYTAGGYKSPRIGDYITAFREAAQNLDNIVKGQRPITKLEGYFSFLCDNPNYNPETDNEQDALKQITLLMDQDLYGEYSDEKHDGLTKFYEEIKRTRQNDEDIPAELCDLIKNWITKKTGIPQDSIQLNEGNRLFLMFKISFQIANDSTHGVGITVSTAVECIKWLLDKLVVTREGSNYEVEYRNVIVHAPNEDGMPDYSYYFEEVGGEIQINTW